MKRIGRKTLSLLLALCMVLSLLPAMTIGAAAAVAPIVMVGGVQLVYIKDQPVYATTSSNGTVTIQGATEENYNIKFDGENGVLTMKNAYVVGSLGWTGDVTLKLIGSNTIGLKAGSSASGIFYGGGLTIENAVDNTTGYLTVYGIIQANKDGDALTVNSGNITVYNPSAAGINVTSLTVNDGVLTASSGIDSGVNATTATISGGTVTAVGGTSSGESDGLSGGTITVTGGRLVAKGGKSSYSSAGIFASASLTVSGNADVTAVGGDAPSSYGIYTFNSSSSTVPVTIGDSDNNSKLVAVGGGGSTTIQSYGINASGDITYTGGLVVTKGGYVGGTSGTPAAGSFSQAMNKTADFASLTSGADYVASGAYTDVYYVVSPAANGTPAYTVLPEAKTVSNATDTLSNTIIVNPSQNSSTQYSLSYVADTDITLTGYNVVLGGDYANSAAIHGFGDDTGKTLNFTAATANGDSLTAIGGYSGTPDGIIALRVNITNANITAIAGTSATDPDFGLYAITTATNANVIAIGGSNESSTNILSCGTRSLISAINSVVTAIGGATSAGESYGVGQISTLTSSALTAIGGSGATSYGIKNENLDPCSGNITAIAGPGTTAKALYTTSNSAFSTSSIVAGSATGKYAVMAPDVAVTFDFNGALLDEKSTKPVTAKNGIVELPTRFYYRLSFLEKGFTFGGWYTDKNYTTRWAAPTETTKSADSAMTVYAKWTNAAGNTVRSTALDFTENAEKPEWQTGCTNDETTKTLWNNAAEGWSYDTNTKTLTLTDASICTTASPSIKLPAGATIKLAGTHENAAAPANSLSDSGLTTSAAYGIDCAGDLTVKGTGTLFAVSAPSRVGMSCGIHSAGKIDVSDGSKVVAYGDRGSGDANKLATAGIYAATDITVSGDTTELYALANSGGERNYSISSYSDGKTTVSGDALFFAHSSGPMAVYSKGDLSLGSDVKMTMSAGLHSAVTGVWDGTTYDASTKIPATPAGNTILSSTPSGQPARIAIVNFGSAAISGESISGTTGVALTGTATITLTGNKFNEIKKGTKIGSDNLEGVDVYAAADIAAGAETAQVTFSGTPESGSTAPILVSINPTNLSRGKHLSSLGIPVITTANPAVKWNIAQGKVKRTTTLDLASTSVTYTNTSGSTGASADPTTASITDTAENWTWYATATTVDGTTYAAKTLILDGADIDVTSGDAIKLPDGATIVVKSASTAATSDSKAAAVDGADALTITGSGKFTVNGTGAYQTGASAGSSGIRAFGNLTLTNANIDANTKAGAIYSDKDILIDGGIVNAAGTDIKSEPTGLSADNITIKGGASVTASGDYAAILCEGGTLTLENETITDPTGAVIGKHPDEENSFTVLNGTKVATSVAITKKADSGSTGGYTGGSTTSTTTSTVVVDGKTTDAGKVTTTTNTDGTKNTTVAVDTTKLNAQVAAADKGSSVQVTVPATTGTASTQLVVRDVENLSQKDMSLEIKTGDTTYTIAPNAIDTAKVASELGATDTSKVPLTVTVTPVKQSDVTVSKGEQVADPVKFEITASYNGKTVSVSAFNSYVERTLTVSAGVGQNKITTGIRTEDGEQVPTFVSKNADGSYTAKISSLTNSTYVIIYNEASFTDTAGKWYSDIVTEMASRTIVNGKTATTFDGDGFITRAEYAAILVRALGIPEGGASSFSDVGSSDWYCGAVSAAVQYGIIKGYADGTFRPNANITREEAMAMLQRAAKVAEFTGTTGTLTAFTDAGRVSAWARTAAAFSVGSGLIVGNGGLIRPEDNITRAESAAVILRLLQKSGLVDVRSKT